MHWTRNGILCGIVVCGVMFSALAQDKDVRPLGKPTAVQKKAGGVVGRYVWFGNALSEKMELREFEVYSGVKNVVSKRPEVFTTGLEYGWYGMKRSEQDLRDARNMLCDGNLDINQRVGFGSRISCAYLDMSLRYSSLELDLGKEVALDRIAIYRSRYTGKTPSDLGWRILVVLDEKRRIVSCNAFNVYEKGWDDKQNNGCISIDLEPAKGPQAGRIVPKNARSWLSEAEYIRDCLGKPVVDLVENITPGDKERLARFEARNSPEAIRALAKKFFARVDLNQPDLRNVRDLVARERYSDALEAFKVRFLSQLGPDFIDWNAGEGTSISIYYSWQIEPDTLSECRARDLRNHIYGDSQNLVVKRFRQGLLPPVKFSFPMQTRPLLLNYAQSKDVQDLRLWEAMTDDWAMGYQEAADKNPDQLRNIFVLDASAIRSNLRDLWEAGRANPRFVKDLSGATLARFLMPVIEEFPVASWRVVRKAVFNHTFNAVPGGINVAKLLTYFHAGQRFEKEMIESYQRLWTTHLTRDGSMVEVGDEGHYMSVICSPGDLYGDFAHKGAPSWFTPALETIFLDSYRNNILAGVRNLSPCGAHVRWNATDDTLFYIDLLLDMKDPYWRNACGSRRTWGDYYTELTKPVLHEPEARAYVDTVYGRGRETFEKGQKKQEQGALLKVYPGRYDGAPKNLSDWLPYTGLWYFRGGWEHEASFLHMVKPTSPNNNGGGCLNPLTNVYGHEQFNDSSYRFYDYATPLTSCMGIFVDSLPPCPEEGRNPSGSKQEIFTQASDKPQNGRWHTDALLDFGETTFTCNYLESGLRFNHKTRQTEHFTSPHRVDRVTTTRQIFQIRPARLFLQVDRQLFSDPRAEHTLMQRHTLILPEARPELKAPISIDQIKLDNSLKTLTMRNPGNTGLVIGWFGQRNLTAQRKDADPAHPSFGKLGGPSITYNGYRKTVGRYVDASWKASGSSVLISSLRASKPDEEPVQAMIDRSSETVAACEISLKDGIKVILLAARDGQATLQAGDLSCDAEILLMVEEPGKSPYGFLLGAKKATRKGKSITLVSPDIRFELSSSVKQIPILRPIDPPVISPETNVFTENAKVVINSSTPNLEIEYIVEAMPPQQEGRKIGGLSRASVNAKDWQPYRGAFTITNSSFVRARAKRPGIAVDNATFPGTQVSAISYGLFYKENYKSRVNISSPLERGLEYEYLEDSWFSLWTYTDQLEAKKTGTTAKLIDVSMRSTDGPFAVRTRGYIEIPKDGVYTFYGPDEFINKTCEPGYDLRLFIDEKEWSLGQIWHGRGMWSVPLAKGLHHIRVTFADARAKDLQNQRVDLWRHYPWVQTTWKGVTPVLEISGPDLPRQQIPDNWFKRAAKP